MGHGTTSQTCRACYQIIWLPLCFKCNSQTLVAFHVANSGCSNWRLFPLATSSGCSGLETVSQVRMYCAVCHYPSSDLPPQPPPQPAGLPQDVTSVRSALCCLLCPLRVAQPPLSPQLYLLPSPRPKALRRGHSPVRSSGRPVAMMAPLFGPVSMPREGSRLSTLPPKLSHKLLEKRRPLSIMEKMTASNSWILTPRLCDLKKASLSSSGKWGISQTAGPEEVTRIERLHLKWQTCFGCQRSDQRPDSFLLCSVAWHTALGMQ